MKKFKDLKITIGSDSQAMKELVTIAEKCDGSIFTFSEEIEKSYQQDDKVLHIMSKVPNAPEAIILVFANEGCIKVINIVPLKKGGNSLTKNEYNRILDFFDDEIVRPLFNGKYDIIKTNDNVKMEELVPKSYGSLIRFVECPGKESPFSHPSDREKWYDFICTLFSNNEYLSPGDLEQWLLEDKCRDSELVDEIIVKYEDATELLDYYDRNYN